MNDNTSQINTDNGFEFHMEEFKQLKEEMRQFQKTRLQLEIFTISAAGLLVAFFVTNKSLIENSSAEFIWWSPLLVLYFGLIWTRTQTQRNMEIGAYLARVEARFGLPELGWERTIAPLKVARGGGISNPKKILWIGLFISFGLIAIKFGANPIWRLFQNS